MAPAFAGGSLAAGAILDARKHHGIFFVLIRFGIPATDFATRIPGFVGQRFADPTVAGEGLVPRDEPSTPFFENSMDSLSSTETTLPDLSRRLVLAGFAVESA
jgi:hypothetical protein